MYPNRRITGTSNSFGLDKQATGRGFDYWQCKKGSLSNVKRIY